MANPNIVSVTSILGNTTFLTPADTSANVLLSNAASSGNVLKINQIVAANVDLTSQVTGTLPVANGGTGATTITANNVVLGNGTSAVQTVAPGTSGNILTSNGTTWQSTAPAASGISAGLSIALAMVMGF